MPRWKTGSEAPPFHVGNEQAIAYLQALVDGGANPPVGTTISCALVVQLYLLFIDKAGHEELKVAGWHGVYTTLACLAFGSRVSINSEAAKRLQTKIDRAVKKGSRNKGGLIQQFRNLVTERRGDPIARRAS